MRGWKNIFHANRNNNKVGVAIVMSDKIDFKTKAVTKDKEGHYIMIKGSIEGKMLHSLTYTHPVQGHLNI